MPRLSYNLELIFLSTPSARRATAHIVGRLDVGAISIHALREEGDMGYGSCSHRSSNFYPRPPRGGRLSRIGIDEGTDQFLSTPSARRATTAAEHPSGIRHISIHALREEGDGIKIQQNAEKTISIHALREEGDSKNRDKISIFKQIIQHSARI